MTGKRLEDLSPEELQEMMDGMLSDDFDKVTVTEFFGALAAMDEEPESPNSPSHGPVRDRGQSG